MPADVLLRVRGWNDAERMKRLADAQTKLKAFSKVNKKALDQDDSIAQQRESMGDRCSCFWAWTRRRAVHY